jgi:hypothetical protein
MAAAPARRATSAMTILSSDDRVFLDRFFERTLELHASGQATTESAVDYLARIAVAIDEHDAGAIRAMRAILEEAWREDDS